MAEEAWKGVGIGRAAISGGWCRQKVLTDGRL